MINDDDKKSLFHLYPVMSRINREVVDQVLESCQMVLLSRGTRVFQELDACRAFPFVLSGDLRVYKQSEGGRELSLYHIRAGDACIVSAGCLLGEKVYNAVGLVQEDACVIMMPDLGFDRLMAEKAFRNHIFSLISNRVLGLMQLVEEVAFHRLDRRLAALLLGGGMEIHASHQELADELGTVREMITRVLNHFAEDGLISIGRGRITILDEQGLKQLL